MFLGLRHRDQWVHYCQSIYSILSLSQAQRSSNSRADQPELSDMSSSRLETDPDNYLALLNQKAEMLQRIADLRMQALALGADPGGQRSFELG